MLKLLWLLDVACLLLALGMALFTSGQDAAGRGILWFFPLAFALTLGASWAADRAGARALALGLAGLAPGIALVVMLTTGRSLLAERAQRSGSAYWSEPGMRRMAQAVAAGDTAAMRAAAPGLDLDLIGRDETTLLTFAIQERPDAVAALLALGARPDVHAPGTTSPLERALDAMDPAFTALLEGGADPNGPADAPRPPIFQAIRDGTPDRLAALLAHGADVRRLDDAGRTTLMAAAQARRWAIALDLLARGVDPEHRAPDGATLRTLLERARDDASSDPAYRTLVDRLGDGAAPR
jgi:hypothetical protein